MRSAARSGEVAECFTNYMRLLSSVRLDRLLDRGGGAPGISYRMPRVELEIPAFEKVRSQIATQPASDIPAGSYVSTF